MCVGAAIFGSTKLAGGLSAATAFNVGLGLTAANAFVGRAAAQSRAEQIYQSSLIQNRSAEDAKRLKQQALEERQSEEAKSAAQEMFAKNIQALQASRAIIASERAGTTIGLLLMDQERQAANYRESVNQTLESARRQHVRSIQATEAEFENRRNEIQSNINQAYNQIPSIGQTLLSIASSGLQSYVGIASAI
jgi:hypothetical protein